MTKFSDRIEKIVGPDNIRTDIRERTVNAVDIGVMPKLVRPFIPAGLPGAVVRPETEQQICDIVKASRDEDVPLTVRAGATSGYGGILPKKGATVVDLSGWDKVISIDSTARTVRCQASAIWEEIDTELAKHGFELALYPSSYPSSTVGGWLAQGGGGFGSYEYGTFKENVVSVRMVTPEGNPTEVPASKALDLIADAEGITGIITEVTFKVRPLEKTVVKLASFSTTKALGAAFSDLTEQSVPLWSVTFFNPTSVKLKKKLPSRKTHPYMQDEVERERAMLNAMPETYLALFAFPASRLPQVIQPLETAVRKQGGTFLSDEQAEMEWADRTNAMRLKRLGPSIIPTEVIVPLREMATVLDEIDQKIDQPFVLEGMLSNSAIKDASGAKDSTGSKERSGAQVDARRNTPGTEVVLLGYIPHDERTFNFNMAFALALSVMKIANDHHGSCYATGLYFRDQAENLLGAEKCDKLRAYKRAHDPRNILNPGKVLFLDGERGGVLGWLMRTAMRFERTIRPIANAAKPGNKPTGGTRNGISSEVGLDAMRCARCGYCVHTCEQYSGRGWESNSPRGKYTWLQEIYEGRQKWDKTAADTMLLCTTCERCDFRCQLHLPVAEDGMSLRQEVVKDQGQGTFPPFEMMAASLQGEGDIWAGRQEHRDAWLPDDVRARLSEKADVLYFAGCTASFVENDIAESTLRLLLDSDIDVCYMGEDESCCGIPMKMAGKWDVFTEMYRRNTTAARARGAKTIVTSCPACALVWKEMYAEEAARLGEPYEFTVKHYSEIIAPAIQDGTIELTRNSLAGHTITFHDSCHAGRAQGIYEPPREMLKAIPGVDYTEMEHNRQDAICCGSVATLVGEVDVAPGMGCDRLQEAVDAGADTVVALCPCCQVQLRDAAEKGNMDVTIDDLARVVAEAAGYDIPTSSAYTSYAWGWFEKFIYLMKPENMAAFMEPLFPAMFDAMPAAMQPMMRMMSRSEGGLALIGKMMPTMFPKMAPGIMDKVMDRMVNLILQKFGGMPDDMKSLMPDMLPKTMQSLMPTYIPQLVPYVVPRFVDWLRATYARPTTTK